MKGYQAAPLCAIFWQRISVAIGEKKRKRARVPVPVPAVFSLARTVLLAMFAVAGAAYGVYRGDHYKPLPMTVPVPTASEIPAPDLTTAP
jgi:hypothetical protein